MATVLPCRAEEGGVGHYVPGTLSRVMAMLPSEGSMAVQFAYVDTQGEFPSEKVVPVAGKSVTQFAVDSREYRLDMIWNTGVDAGHGWTYSTGLSVPYLSVRSAGRGGTDSASGLGDIVLAPLILTHGWSEHWRTDIRFAVHTPTGNYDRERTANPGRHYWTFEPAIGLYYMQPFTGQMFSVYGGMNINTTNTATDYHTGTQVFLESTLTQSVLMLGGMVGLGITGFAYQQVEGDSGSGALEGAFKGRALGLGPVLQYRAQLAGAQLAADMEWRFPFATQNRPDSDSFSVRLQLIY
ncbi:SphA family protein [Photobacterium aquae]|nr:transporter [Photobacterium aquae]